MRPDEWVYENEARSRGFKIIAGTDEAGRGPLAGPVVAAAVVLPEGLAGTGITDSKKLSPTRREVFYDFIYSHASAVGLGIVDPAEIDRTNILRASLAAMKMAVYNLSPLPDFVIVDGTHPLPVDIAQNPVAGGDCLSISTAAASIVAKVTRDRMMEAYASDYPEYDFPSNKGYPTKAHKTAIEAYGPCLIHRMSFKGVQGFSA